MFGDVDFDPSCSYTSVPLEEQLQALGDAVTAGKIRHAGISNETAWGLMRCCALSATPGEPFWSQIVVCTIIALIRYESYLVCWVPSTGTQTCP